MVLSSRRDPQQDRSCLGILRLGKSYSEESLEAACCGALLLGTHRYKWIESILKRGLHRKLLSEQKALRFTGMVKVLTEQAAIPEIEALSFDQRLRLLIDREKSYG